MAKCSGVREVASESVQQGAAFAPATFTAGGWQVFSTSGKPTPEAAVADLVLQLADWQSRQGDHATMQRQQEERSRGNVKAVQAKVDWLEGGAT